MGGVDKGLQLHLGRPLVAQVIERLAPQVAALSISANRHLAEYAAFGHPVLPDTWPDFAGPLAGIHAGLLALPPGTWLLVAPCDVPGLPLDLGVRLMAAGAPAALPRAAGRLQPGCCLVHASLTASLGAYLDGGGRKLQGWLLDQGAVVVEFDRPGDAAAFSNFNTRDDLNAV